MGDSTGSGGGLRWDGTVSLGAVLQIATVLAVGGIAYGTLSTRTDAASGQLAKLPDQIQTWQRETGQKMDRQAADIGQQLRTVQDQVNKLQIGQEQLGFISSTLADQASRLKDLETRMRGVEGDVTGLRAASGIMVPGAPVPAQRR